MYLWDGADHEESLHIQNQKSLSSLNELFQSDKEIWKIRKRVAFLLHQVTFWGEGVHELMRPMSYGESNK